MKRILAILVPIALAACQTVPTDAISTDPADVKVVTADDKSAVKDSPKADETVEPKPEDISDDADDAQAGDVKAVDDKADAASVDDDAKTPAKDETETKQPVAVPQNFVQYYKSDLVMALVTDALIKDDVALMGIVSGARAYCQLRWESGFITFMTAAKRQGLDLNLIADDHGYYHGAAVKALADAQYACTKNDLIDLRAIEPY